MTENIGNPRSGMREFVERKKGSTLLRLVSYFKYHKGLTALSVLLALAVNVAAIAQPFLLRNIIDDNLAKGIYDQNAIVTYGLLYFAAVVLGSAGGYSQTVVLSRLGQLIMHRLRTSLFSHIQSQSMGFFDKNSSGRILTRLNSDIESLSELYSGTLLTIIKDTLLIAGIIIAMFGMNPGLAFWCMWSVPVVAALTVLFRLIARKNFMMVKAQLSKINSFLAESITGMKIIQIFAREDEKLGQFHEMGERYCRLGVREIMLNSLSNPMVIAVSNIMTAMLVGLFASRVELGLLEVGTIYAFTVYIKQLFNPIAEIADQFTSIQSALISADRVFDLMDIKDSAEDFTGGLPVHSLKGDIEFKNVWFAYNGDNWVLRDVSFTISAGQSAAFIGATGSGKSTVISLLARFYDINRGQILVDGVDIREYNLRDLRRCISVVMQDVFLFSGDLRYNIRLNEPGISDEDIDSAVRSIHADGFINSLEGGYSHVVAERGGAFSAGERQLVSFARAVAFRPSIYILDEATANIDTQAEAAIQQAVESISDRHTVITIAHRLTTITGCNVIFVMSCGRIVQRGTHGQLYAEEGLYRRLYDRSCAAAEEDGAVKNATIISGTC